MRSWTPAGRVAPGTLTDHALVQIGGTAPEQNRFFAAVPELITAMRETAG